MSPVTAQPASKPATRTTHPAGRDRLDHRLGAHVARRGNAAGTRFAVWAPNARGVAFIGDFNGWDTAVNPLAKASEGGVWEGFVPGVGPGALYKYAITPPSGGRPIAKADPV